MSIFIRFHARTVPRKDMQSAIMHRATWRIMAVQDHPRSSTLVLIESLYMQLPISVQQ